MPFADHHDMGEAFPSNRSNHALGIRVLPGRASRNDRFPDVQRLRHPELVPHEPPAAAVQDRRTPHPYARYFTLQLAESYLTGNLFRQILQRIERLS